MAGPNKDILRLMYAMVDRNDTMVAELRSHNVPKRLLAWLLSAAEDEDELESIETALQVNKRIEGNQKCRAGLAYYLARDRACRRLVYLPCTLTHAALAKTTKTSLDTRPGTCMPLLPFLAVVFLPTVPWLHPLTDGRWLPAAAARDDLQPGCIGDGPNLCGRPDPAGLQIHRARPAPAHGGLHVRWLAFDAPSFSSALSSECDV